VQGSPPLAEAVNEAPSRLFVIADLHQRAGEIEVRDICGLPLRGLRRKPIQQDQFRRQPSAKIDDAKRKPVHTIT
jgi:hypothetical protein